MSNQAYKFQIIFTPKVKKQLKSLPPQIRQQYDKAFQLVESEGLGYRSLRTHRYQQKNGKIWGSSASMSLRFYWDYVGERTILVTAIGSH